MEDLVVESAVDIDSSDLKNPLAVVEYIEDIYSYFKRVEVNFWFFGSYFCFVVVLILINEIGLSCIMIFVKFGLFSKINC